MNNLDLTGLELSTQLLIKEAVRRGIEVDVLDRHDHFIRLRKKDRTEYIKQATRTSLDTYIAPLIMENKEVTKLILREHGIQVPNGISVFSLEEAESVFTQFQGRSIVVKPKSTNFGIGVHVLKTVQRDEYMESVARAFEHDHVVMIEEFIEGREYRFLVIGEETAAVLYRVPANVQGDGVHSIAELVEEKNKDPLRGEGYVTPLEKIKLGEVERAFLHAQGLSIDVVPAAGQVVYLRENSNISTGGDSIDFTDEMPDFYKDIAVKAAKAVGARICGADMIVRDLDMGPTSDGYSIIELNFNPALHIHNYPYRGMNREVEKKVLNMFELT